MNIMQRVMLANIMPDKATFEVGIIINDIRKKLAITQDEVVRTKMASTKEGGLQWDTAKEKPVDVEFTDAECEIIAGALKKASDDGRLPTEPAVIELYRKFVLADRTQPAAGKKSK